MAAKNTRKILWIPVLFLAGLFFFFLPVFLSSAVVLDLIEQELCSRLSITLELGSCSIGWFRGLEVRNLTCRKPELGVELTVPRVSGSRGLLALVAAPKNLGVFTLEQPVVRVGIRSRTQSPVQTTRQESIGEAVPGTWFLPPWDELLVQLRIIDGAIQQAGLLSETPHRFRIKAALEGGTITFSSSVLLAMDKGQVVTVRGRVNLPPAHLGIDTGALVVKASVGARHFALASLLERISGRTGWPLRGDGVLDLDLEYHYSGSGFVLESQAQVKQFALFYRQKNILSGEPLKVRLSLGGTGTRLGKGLVREGRLQLDSRPGRLWFDFENFPVPVSAALQGRYRVFLNMDLERLGAILHQGKWLDPELRFGGSLQLEGAGYFEDSLLVLPRFKMIGEQVVFRGPLDCVEEPHLAVQAGPGGDPDQAVMAVRPLTVATAMEPWFRAGGGHTAVDLTGHTVYLRGLRLQTSAGTISLDEMVFDDWSRFLSGAVQILKQR
ncbi:hypothetical protein [Desulfolithobacter sp.]